MPLLRRFGLHLDPPSAGWLPITLTLDDEVFSWAASDVLNDALAELATAALALDDEALSETITIWLEPDTIELQLTAGAGSDVVDIVVYETDIRTAHATATIGRATLRVELLRALVTLQAEASPAVMLDQWHGFPTAAVRQLLGEQRLDDVIAGLRPPWRAIADLLRIREEIIAEVGRRHVLYGAAFALVAVNDTTGAYLLELTDGLDRFATIALTWTGDVHKDPAAPTTRLFRTWRQWREQQLLPDAEQEAP